MKRRIASELPPHLPVSDYSLRNTGNRGLEEIHGIFRGGSASLPITSQNLSFREFLSKMNQTLQVHQAEKKLKQISGHKIVASKKKRAVCAHQSCDQEYTKPETYKEFLEQIMQACMDGDEDSKVAITQSLAIAWQLLHVASWPATDRAVPYSGYGTARDLCSSCL